MDDQLLKKADYAFRGLELGTRLETVVEVEGEDYEHILGSLPHYEYYQELSDQSELFLYYNYDSATQQVTSIRLQFLDYPKIAWKKASGTGEVAFFDLVQQGDLAPYDEAYQATATAVYQRLEQALGTPTQHHTTDAVFQAAYQQFQQWVWQRSDGNRLSLTRYLDDQTTSSTRLVLDLHLYR